MGSQIYMLTPIGVITPVVLPWEYLCLLSAQSVNFGCNEGNVVQLYAYYITFFVFPYSMYFTQACMQVSIMGKPLVKDQHCSGLSNHPKEKEFDITFLVCNTPLTSVPIMAVPWKSFKVM